MTTPPIEWCGASTRGFGPMPIGPCVLRHGHVGPLHRDEAGVAWTDPQPASESTEPLCPQATDPCGDEHTETGRRCTRTAGHDTHRSGGTAWTYLADDTIDKWRARAEKAERELSDALQAWTAVREESAALIQEYSELALERQNRCGSCRQHETVDRKDAAARAMAKTARRYKRERDDARDVLREFVSDTPCDPHPGNGFCQTHGERKPCPHAAAKRLLDPPEAPAEPEHTGGNAEDCPACRPLIDQPGRVQYPWICPALDQPEGT